MRHIIVLACLFATVMVVMGCFHHRQAAVLEPLPPPPLSTTPYK
jgi:hypothetical protein